MKRTTKAFWQGVFASLVASVVLEGAKVLATRAEETADAATMDVDLPPIPFVDDLDPVVRLVLLAAVGLGLGWGLYLLLQKLGIDVAAMVLPTIAVVAIIAAYVWLVF